MHGAVLPLEFVLVKVSWLRARFKAFVPVGRTNSILFFSSCCLVYSRHVRQESFNSRLFKHGLLVIIRRASCVEDGNI